VSSLPPFHLKNLSVEGPVGPSAFWKVTNGIGDMSSDVGDHMDDEDDDDDDDDYDEEEDVEGHSHQGVGVLGTVITITL
jgi:hypothetical protein